MNSILNLNVFFMNIIIVAYYNIHNKFDYPIIVSIDVCNL